MSIWLNNYILLVYNQEMWTLEQLITFRAVVERQHFAYAAEELRISAAAVGKQIKTLENAIGITLFYRTTRRVNLTDAGAAFYEQAKKVLSEAETTNDLIASQKGEAAGMLKIICSVFFGEQIISPLLPKFMHLYPKIRLDIESSDRIPDLESEKIDASIGLIGAMSEHYVRRKLHQDRHILCASPEYLKKHGIPKNVNELSLHHFITHSKRPQPNELPFGGEIIHINPIISTNNTNIMVQLCLQGVGFALLHSDLVASHINNSSLVELFPEKRESLRDMYIYFKKSQYLQPKLRAFIDFLLKEAS